MAEIIKMPRLSDTMTEGSVSKWHKKVGDVIKEGDLLAEIETDKATMEFESFQSGVLLHIGIEEGKTAAVDAILAILGKKGEDRASLLSDSKKEKEEKATVVHFDSLTKEDGLEEIQKTEIAGQKPKEISIPNERVKASPLAKKVAKEKGLDLGRISGSGEGGRVTKKDIDNIEIELRQGRGVSFNKIKEINISQMRKTIAKRLSESKFTAPHFYLTMSINMNSAIKARKVINNESSVKISFNDMIVKAVAKAIETNPNINTSWLSDKIRYNEHINIGVAVAIEDGLLVPVVKYANTKSLKQISNEVSGFVEKAKKKTLNPEDWAGSTFTISNLGMFGIDEFTAIINPPDACILAIGGINNVPVVKDDDVVPGHIMKVTLSCDHRVVDGATGANFLYTLKTYLENPVLVFYQ